VFNVTLYFDTCLKVTGFHSDEKSSFKIGEFKNKGAIVYVRYAVHAANVSEF